MSSSAIIGKRGNFLFTDFGGKEEKSLKEYILMCSKMYHGLDYRQVQKLAFEFAEKRDILFP